MVRLIQLENSGGTMELIGDVIIGDKGELRSGGGILQGDHYIFNAGELNLFSKSGNVDLSRGQNKIGQLSADVAGGITVNLGEDTRIGDIKSCNGDIILSGERLSLEGYIQAGESGDKNIIVKVNDRLNEVEGGRIQASDLGLSGEESFDLGGTNRVNRIAAAVQQDLTVGQVSGFVQAVSGVTLSDNDDSYRVTGIHTGGHHRSLGSDRQILINEEINVDAGATICLKSGTGILQSSDGVLRGKGLEILGAGSVDLSHGENGLQEIAVDLRTGIPNKGFIFKGNDIKVDSVGDIHGITADQDVILMGNSYKVEGDAIIKSSKGLNLTENIEAANNLSLVGDPINQDSNGRITGSGLEDRFDLAGVVSASNQVQDIQDINLEIRGTLVGNENIVGKNVKIVADEGVLYSNDKESVIISESLDLEGAGNFEVPVDTNNLSAEIDGGLVIKTNIAGFNDLDDKINIKGIKLADKDLIIQGNGDINTDGNISGKYIVIEGKELSQGDNKVIEGKGLGVSLSGETEGVLRTEVFGIGAKGSEGLRIENDSEILLVKTVRATAVPVNVDDLPNEASVSGLKGDGGINLVQSGIIVQQEGINTPSGGIVQEGVESQIETASLSVRGKAANLGGANQVDEFSGKADLGLFINNEKSLIINDNGIQGGNLEEGVGDSIIDVKGNLDIKSSIAVGDNLVLEVEGKINQDGDGLLSGKGLGIKTNFVGVTDLFGRFVALAVEAPGDIHYKNEGSLAVRNVDSMVPPVTAFYSPENRFVSQITGNNVRLFSNELIQIDVGLLVQENTTLEAGMGIRHSSGMFNNSILTQGLALKGRSPIDLTNSENKINTIAGSVSGTNFDEGLIVYSKTDLIVGGVGETVGIKTNNTDVILESGGDLVINKSIDVGGGNLSLSADKNVKQLEGDSVSSDGLGARSGGYVDMGDGNNSFSILAVDAGEGITVQDRNGFTVGKIDAKVRAVTEQDTDDLKSLVGIETAQDVIISTPELKIDESLTAGGHVTIVSEQISNNNSLQEEGLAIQGNGTRYELNHPGNPVNHFTWETDSSASVELSSQTNYNTENDITSRVGNDEITTRGKSSENNSAPDDTSVEVASSSQNLSNSSHQSKNSGDLAPFCTIDYDSIDTGNYQEACLYKKDITYNIHNNKSNSVLDAFYDFVRLIINELFKIR